MNFSLQDRPCSNRMADSWFPTAVISHFYSAVYVALGSLRREITHYLRYQMPTLQIENDLYRKL